jgi:hypothetical protein
MAEASRVLLGFVSDMNSERTHGTGDGL